MSVYFFDATQLAQAIADSLEWPSYYHSRPQIEKSAYALAEYSRANAAAYNRLYAHHPGAAVPVVADEILRAYHTLTYSPNRDGSAFNHLPVTVMPYNIDDDETTPELQAELIFLLVSTLANLRQMMEKGIDKRAVDPSLIKFSKGN